MKQVPNVIVLAYIEHTLSSFGVSKKKSKVMMKKCMRSQLVVDKLCEMAGKRCLGLVIYKTLCGIGPASLASMTNKALCERIDLIYTTHLLEELECQK
jgi:hypothetical protein